jgi:hypothetical protein
MLSGCARHGDGWLANVNCADANGLRIALLQTKQFTFSEGQVAPPLRRANAAQFKCKPTLARLFVLSGVPCRQAQ